MRTLKLKVEGQILSLDPSCDLYDLVPGSNSFIRLEFTFSNEWRNTAKVVGFYSKLGREYPPQPLRPDETCIVPIEALKRREFKIKVIGQNGLVTNKIAIEQKGG